MRGRRRWGWSAERRLSHARARAGEGFIYAAFIECVDRTSHIKIGFSLRPHRRVYRDIESFANVRACRLLGYVAGSMRAEMALHNTLYGRPRCVKKGDREEYSLSILDHPAIPAGLIWERPAA